MAKPKPIESHLPTRKQAPKHTGKRGVKPPLDPDEDFDKDTKKPEQAELLKLPPAPAIQHGKMSVHFVHYTQTRSKDHNPIVNMDFSLELEDGHAGRIPNEVEDEWKHLKRGSVKRTEVEVNGSQNLSLYLVADTNEPALEVIAAVAKAVISRIVEKGRGKNRKVTRLQVRFLTSFTDDVARFCRIAQDETIWIAMKETQRSFTDSAPTV